MSDLAAVLAATETAAAEIYGPDGRRLEARLVDAVAGALYEPVNEQYRSDEVIGWQRQPGGVDLAIVEHGRARTLMEMKVDDLEQCLWDIFKLASLQQHPHIGEAYLVYEAAQARFESNRDCAELFRSAGVVGTIDLVRRWPRAWAYLLEGGYENHPETAPANLMLSARGAFPLRSDPNHEIRVVEIELVGDEATTFDSDGWPAAIPMAERPYRNPGPRPRTPELTATGDRVSPPSGHLEVPKPMSQRWLRNKVPHLSQVQLAQLLETLRDRGWTEEEFEQRILPLSSSKQQSRLPSADEVDR